MKIIIAQYRFSFIYRFLFNCFHRQKKLDKRSSPFVFGMGFRDADKFSEQMDIANCVVNIAIFPVRRPAIMNSSARKT